MKIILLHLAVIIIAFSSCKSALKLAQNGQYDEAVQIASKKVIKGSDNTKDIEALVRGYELGNKVDREDIKKWQSSNSPDKWVNIAQAYQNIKVRQSYVRQIGGLHFRGKEYNFPIDNNIYTKEKAARDKAAEYYYKQAESNYQRAKSSKNKDLAKKAFYDYEKIRPLYVYYKEKTAHQEESYFLGSTKVFFDLQNKSGQKLPDNFEYNVNRLPVQDLNSNWVVYYSDSKPGYKPDYIIHTTINSIDIGPDQTRTNTYDDVTDIVESYRQGTDANGNAVQIPVTSRVGARVQEVIRYKEGQIAGEMTYLNNKGQVVHKEPIGFKAVYQNSTAQYQGDQRALSQESIQKIQNQSQRFPTDEELINFSGLQLQSAIKTTLINNRAIIK